MKHGYEFGLIDRATYEKMLERERIVDSVIDHLRNTRYQNLTLDTWLKRPEVSLNSLIPNYLETKSFDECVTRKIEWDVKYEGYTKRQIADVVKFSKLEKRKIPGSIDYSTIRGLGREAKEKLSKIRPISIGQATRIPGLTSCDISLLLVHCERTNQANYNQIK